MRQFKKSFVLLVVFLLFLSTPAFAEKPGLTDFPEPLDPKSWELPEDMTWDDYKPVPGYDWQNTNIEPQRVIKGALIVVDFSDREFIVSGDVGSELAGNPINGNIPRDEVPQFWEDFLTKPQALNNYRTIDEFWRENSFGNWAVELEAFGPYRMPHTEFDYGMNEWNQQENKPPQSEGSFDLRSDARAIAQADIDASGEEFDFVFILHAGYDESGVWQEFGEMMFQTAQDVTDEFGVPAPYDPDNLMANWANTRYVPWTSWIAASSLWSRAGSGVSIQGENDGMGTFAHEFGHIMALADNYNNPYGSPVSRSYSGPWELMSRGSFNGPGGPHTRWMVMPTLGASSPSHHMLRNKIKQGFLTEDQYINISREELADTGPLFADVLAREIPAGSEFGRSDVVNGINIQMEDLTPANSLEDDWRADMQRGAKWYNNYTVEVVDRIGFDSFQTDSGVLLAKTKDAERSPNIWVVDSHPEDINQVDFIRPDGTEAMYSKGDYRQLADALFKAGTGDGVISEYVDEHNRLHFYILNKTYDDVGALSYRVAVRHMDSAGPFTRGVTASRGSTEFAAAAGNVAVYKFNVTNTGDSTDIFRLDAKTAAGWNVMLQNNFIEVPAGETVEVPVYVKIPEEKPVPNNLTFTSTSETDSQQSANVSVRVGPGKGK